TNPYADLFSAATLEPAAPMLPPTLAGGVFDLVHRAPEGPAPLGRTLTTRRPRSSRSSTSTASIPPRARPTGGRAFPLAMQLTQNRPGSMVRAEPLAQW